MCISIVMSTGCQKEMQKKKDIYSKILPERKILEICGGHDGPVIRQGDPGTEGNKYGFEGGRAFKYKGDYHIFTAERVGDPIIVKMKMAHWKSSDGVHPLLLHFCYGPWPSPACCLDESLAGLLLPAGDTILGQSGGAEMRDAKAWPLHWPEQARG